MNAFERIHYVRQHTKLESTRLLCDLIDEAMATHTEHTLSGIKSFESEVKELISAIPRITLLDFQKLYGVDDG
jgi:hypothetical protein